MQGSADLSPKLIGDIAGDFYVPFYQRGYRWEQAHIEMLLNDIYDNGSRNYCLQPIVVKRIEDNRYELIDGQQRLTSIYLIFKYIKKSLPTMAQKFTLTYETRDQSKAFLESIDPKRKDDNVDFYHIYNAYMAIETWFNNGSQDPALKAINLFKYFCENVKVIWYEVENNVKSQKLFTRLNIGKIPLTNAELVKALFLSKNSDGLTDEKQLEIATSWDLIEKELHDESLWAFLTNEKSGEYQTRIELIFNMMAQKTTDEKDAFFTFFYFTNRMGSESKVEMWKEIEEFYYLLKEWYEHRDIYHKVGYLVSSGHRVQDLKNDLKLLTKSEVQDELDSRICESLNLTKEDILELSYEKTKDRVLIERLLLLFNVESVRRLKDSTERYCFSRHKQRNWSLEHIHAQNSEGLNTTDDRQLWLKLHRTSLATLSRNEQLQESVNAVIERIDENYENITRETFENLFASITSLLSENDDRSYIDLISNMALLSLENNAALNNSTFDVKRNKILQMDRNGEYIPICTRRVFLKYYCSTESTHLQFWGEDDRKAYLDAMIGDDGILTPYLTPQLPEPTDE